MATAQKAIALSENELERAVYLAGMLDFEGSFEVKYDPLPRATVSLAQKSRKFLEAVRSLYDGFIVQTQLKINKTSEVERFLSDVQPYVRMRKEETILALALARLTLKTEKGKPTPEPLRKLRYELAEQLTQAYQDYKASKTMEVS